MEEPGIDLLEGLVGGGYGKLGKLGKASYLATQMMVVETSGFVKVVRVVHDKGSPARLRKVEISLANHFNGSRSLPNIGPDSSRPLLDWRIVWKAHCQFPIRWFQMEPREKFS